MKNEQSIFKLFLTIDLAKQLNNNKEIGAYRYVIDLQDQSKTFNSTSTQSILFFLNEIENNTNMTVKIISEKTNKIIGTLSILIPFAINYEQELTVTESFQFENENKLNGSYTLYLINIPLFKQQGSNDTTSIQKSNTAPQSQKQKKQFSKSPQSQLSQYSYLEKINKEVNQILNKHHHSLSSKKDKTIDTGIVDESPSRISDRVQVSRSGTFVQSEISPSQVRKYVIEDSPSKLNCSFNKEKEINHRHHQELSCLYYLDQATLSNQIQIENENLKETVINLNTKLEYQEQQIILYKSLESNYKDLQNQLQTFLKAQELNKSVDSVFDKEILKVNAQLNQKISQLLENEKKFSKQKLEYEMQISEQRNEINMLRQNLYELSEKQKYYSNLNNDFINQKQQNMELKQEIIKNVKDYETKLCKFDQHITEQNKKIDDQTKQIWDQKQQYQELEKLNKSLSFQLKKLQENYNSQKQPLINIKPINNNNDTEDTSKQLQITQEINQQKQVEIEKLQNALKKAQQQNQDQQNEYTLTKQALNQTKQELSKLKEFNLQNQNQKTKQQTETKQLQQQIETEKSKVATLQSQLKAKSIQLQEAQVRDESQQNKILKLEQIIKQTKNLIENQEEQINLLNNQIKDLQDAKQKQQNDIKEDKEKMNQLKQLISGMKEQRVAYIPMHGDPIDHALSEYINSLDDPKKLIELFFREKEGQYLIGSKSVHLKTEQGKVFVKIGGGFIGIEEFLDVYLKEKTEKIEKKQGQLTPRNKTSNKSQRSQISTHQFTS
ncbi:unnamed protein product [Paramecium primaurelia]|uniref:GAR domain-containing protein n=1 Tax=Paramecium primaurelia TaxID=5886 RepID=A0A8S1LE28_PARPR|nr:unnamed protein product [Paramecium primaurelia]